MSNLRCVVQLVVASFNDGSNTKQNLGCQRHRTIVHFLANWLNQLGTFSQNNMSRPIWDIFLVWVVVGATNLSEDLFSGQNN